eukprot:COSAG06_NODE_2518_length_6729_cov_819.078733_2_plen_237_part_00
MKHAGLCQDRLWTNVMYPSSNAEKWSIIMQFAVPSTVSCRQTVDAHVTLCPARRKRLGSAAACRRKRPLCFECFPYVCLEPVLVKRSFSLVKIGIAKGTATCIIIAPKRLKLRLSGSARKSQKRFRDTPMFKFQAVLTHCQPFLSRSVEKRGDQSRFKCRKMANYCAIRSTCIRHKNFGSCSVGSGATQNVPESPATRTSSKTVPCCDGWLAKTCSGQTVGQAFGPKRGDHKEATK